MGMNAGQLDRRIQVQRFTETGTSALNSPLEDWADLGAPIAAQRRDLSDAERESAGKWDNALVTRFVVRASPFTRAIRRTDRLVHDGLTFEITGIKEVPPGRAFLEITALTSETP